ncbi:MAG: DUF5320 domain-containing protein [Chloroflexi bacterium]|nr:DUF5320 domain-containing protein [Chloroflexota bacterium]
MCGHSEYHSHRGHYANWCDWCGCVPTPWGPRFPFRRRFSTRDERIARLEEYLKALQEEAKAVEERIAELKASK